MFSRDDDALRAGDSLKWAGAEPDVLAAWVADADVDVPAVVAEAIRAQLTANSLGYPNFDAPQPLLGVFERRMAERYGWTPTAGVARLFTDVIQAFQVLVDLLTEPGDGVALHVPAYPIFLTSVADSGRRVVPMPFGADAQELIDLWRVERVGLVVVVNPHNPTGRMLSAEELRPIADAAAELDLVVLSDEIHADLALDGRRHVPFAGLGPDVESRTVTVTSASKAFNLAGLHCAVAHVGAQRVREPLEALPFAYLGGVSTLSQTAAVAAWTRGDAWLAQFVDVLQANRDAVTRWAEQCGVRMTPAEASYLAWLDFGDTALAADPAEPILREARVRLSPGPEFVAHTDHDASAFARLNFGTSPERLGRILDRIGAIL